MRMKITQIGLTLFFIFFSVKAPISSAGWVDDYIDQKSSGGAGYFSGQKRGYVTGGTFRARWKGSDNEPIISAEPPKLKFGCGGIDILTGGVSFMKFEHLVKKLQNTVANAPAVMFDIGLNVICTQCSSAMKSFEGLTNTLNNIQFDDCKASQALVATLAEKTPLAGPKTKAIAETEFMNTKGLTDLFQDSKGKIAKNDNKPTVSDTLKFSSCPVALQEIFLSNTTTLLEAGAKKRNSAYPPVYIDMVRGFVGDIRTVAVNNPNGNVISYIPQVINPCNDNTVDDIESFFNGTAKLRPADGTQCVGQVEKNKSLSNWSITNLRAISKKNGKENSPHCNRGFFFGFCPSSAFWGIKVRRGSITI